MRGRNVSSGDENEREFAGLPTPTCLSRAVRTEPQPRRRSTVLYSASDSVPDDEIRKSVHQSAFTQPSGHDFVLLRTNFDRPAESTKGKHFDAAPVRGLLIRLPISREAPSLSVNLTETERQILPEFISALERRRIQSSQRCHHPEELNQVMAGDTSKRHLLLAPWRLDPGREGLLFLL